MPDTPKLKEERFAGSQCVEVSVHRQLAPRQRGIAEEKQLTAQRPAFPLSLLIHPATSHAGRAPVIHTRNA